MSLFSRLEAMASRTIDNVNAEAFRLTPMARSTDPNGRPQADADRAVIEAEGIFDVTPREFGVELGNRHIGRKGNDLRAVGAGQEPVLSVDTRYLPAMPRQGDVIELLERAGVPAYRVVEVRPDGQSRVELVLAG